MHSHVSAEPVRRALEVENPRGSGCVVIEHASDASASHSYFNAFYISHGSWAKHEAPLGNLRQLRGTAMSVRSCPLSRNRKEKKKKKTQQESNTISISTLTGHFIPTWLRPTRAFRISVGRSALHRSHFILCTGLRGISASVI